MYYLDAYFTERHWPKVGRSLGMLYALALVVGCFGVGNMFQSNQAFQQFIFITKPVIFYFIIAEFARFFGRHDGNAITNWIG